MNALLYKTITEFLEGNIIAAILLFLGLTGFASWWLRGLSDDRKSFKEFINKIDSKIDKIHDKINEIFGRLRPTVADTNSPLVLNDLGRKVAGQIKATEWTEKYVDRLHEKLEDKTNPYEIQKVCFDYAQEELLNDIRNSDGEESREKDLTISAYDNGLELTQVLDVVGIVLRDMLLRKCGLEAPDDLPIPPQHT